MYDSDQYISLHLKARFLGESLQLYILYCRKEINAAST